MKHKTPLLSICIPTYNRASFLEEALWNIIHDEAFGDNVEIIISDNASTDETPAIGGKFAEDFPNVFYYRNEQNIHDRNFILALQRANGKYVRLFNDTLRFKKGALARILKVILTSDESLPLYLFQQIPWGKKQNRIVSGLDEFLDATSYFVTWIANTSGWKKDIQLIMCPDKYSSFKLPQVDWNYQIASHYEKAQIVYDDYFYSATVENKGGYNIFEVFVVNYFKILRTYNLSKKALNKEKHRLLKHFIFPWCISIRTNKKLTFLTSNKWKILLKEYWYKPYFYIGLLVMEYRCIKTMISSLR